MKKLTLLLSLTFFAGLACAEVKIATIDFKYVLENFKERAVAQKEINEEQLALKEEREVKIKELKAYAADLEKLSEQLKDPTLSDKKRQDIQKELVAKQKEAQKKNQDQNAYFQRKGAKLQEKFQEVNKRIFDKIKAVSAEFAKVNGYTYLINSNSLVFAAESEDVSEDLLKLLNK